MRVKGFFLTVYEWIILFSEDMAQLSDFMELSTMQSKWHVKKMALKNPPEIPVILLVEFPSVLPVSAVSALKCRATLVVWVKGIGFFKVLYFGKI